MAHRFWTAERDDEMLEMAAHGFSAPAIAKHFGRTKKAVYARMKALRKADLGAVSKPAAPNEERFTESAIRRQSAQFNADFVRIYFECAP